MVTSLFFAAGLFFLIIGAEILVRGASRLAAVFGISPLVIGLTVVAFGTSSPELAVSIKAALAGQASISLGNVIGSNIFNVLFILGISALVTPLVVSQKLVRLDVPLMIGLSALVFVFGLDHTFNRAEGLFLFAGLIVYVGFMLFQSRKEQAALSDQNAAGYETEKTSTSAWVRNIGLVICGLVLLVVGSRWLVTSAVSIAGYFGVSELIIGLTVVAAGTSLPEVVTSIIASIRGERDIAVGNVVGSNIFNIMAVLGVSSIIAPSGIEVSAAAIRFDIPIMVVVAFACLPIFFTGGIISRMEGALLFFYYIAYTLYLILAASHHDSLPGFSAAMIYFVIPLTLVTMIVVTLREATVAKSR